VTRRVSEKIAQGVAQPIFVKIYALLILWKKVASNLAASKIVKNYPKETINPVGENSPNQVTLIPSHFFQAIPKNSSLESWANSVIKKTVSSKQSLNAQKFAQFVHLVLHTRALTLSVVPADLRAAGSGAWLRLVRDVHQQEVLGSGGAQD
jgi:hypothetical protein